MTDGLAARLRLLVRDVPDHPKPGVIFKDLTPLLADAAAFAATIDAMARPWAEQDPPVHKVVGIEARGFLFAAPIAYSLSAGVVLVRKAGKLPAARHAASYDLEYGAATLELHEDAFLPGDRVLVVDDVLATGGTAAATVDLVRRAGGEVVGVAVLLELGFLAGRERLASQPAVTVHAVIED
ncbi:MAG: adenine phosphoribosyltransferase [Frankiaceae bacterium]